MVSQSSLHVTPHGMFEGDGWMGGWVGGEVELTTTAGAVFPAVGQACKAIFWPIPS